MKKLFTISFLFVFASTTFAQDAKSSAIKNLRFGGTIIPSLTWYKPDNLKKFSSDGAIARFGVLINGEYSFSGNFAFGFGIGLNSGGGKMNFLDTAHYYFNNDAIITLEDTANLLGKYSHYRLNTRTYNASYFILPISIKMRTNEIGFMRYFFQPSINLNIRKKVRADDDLTTISTGPTNGQTANQKDLDITDDMGFLRLSTTLSAGGEYYLSGSTALVFAVGYDYGFSDVVKKKSDYLLKTPYASGGVNMLPTEQKFIQHGVIITVGVLF